MSELSGTIVVIVALFVGVPIGLLWLRDRIKDIRRRGCNPPEKVASDRRAYEERILHPDWEFYRHHLVYITHHDGGDTEVFAESVASMLEGLRHANRRA